MPMWGNPLPWKKTAETPNLGSEDQTDDMRPGLGWTGVAHLQDFVRNGGLLLTVDGHRGPRRLHRLHARPVGRARQRLAHRRQRRAIEDGRRHEPDRVRLQRQPRDLVRQRPIFNLSNIFGGRGGRRLGPDDGGNRPTGRGTADDPDTPQGRPGVEVAGGAEGRRLAGGAGHRRAAAQRHQRDPAGARPRVILRYADTRELLVSGLVENGGEIAQHAAVVDVPLDKGHVVAFSNNPIWRGETEGSYFLVFNALLNFDQLDAGRKLDAR